MYLDSIQEFPQLSLEFAHAPAGQLNVRWQLGFVGLAGDRGGNDGRGMFVSGVVLHDQHRAGASLLASDDRAQVGVKDVASLNGCIHSLHAP